MQTLKTNCCLIVIVLLLTITKSFLLADLPQLQSLKKTKFGSSLLENMSLALGQIKMNTQTQTTSQTSQFITPELLKGAKILKETLLKNKSEKETNENEMENQTSEFKKTIEKLDTEIATLTKESEVAEKRSQEVKDQISKENEHINSFLSNYNLLINQHKELNQSSTKDIQNLQREIKEHERIENLLNQTERALNKMLNSTSGKNISEHITPINAEKRDSNYTSSLKSNKTEVEDNYRNNTFANKTEVEIKEKNQYEANKTSFLQIPFDKEDNFNANFIQMKMKTKADQEKLSKLISFIRNYKFDTGIKRAEIEESIAERIETVKRDLASILKNAEELKKLKEKAEKNIKFYQEELSELEKSKNEKSEKLKSFTEKKTLKVIMNSKFLELYAAKKVQLQSEYESLEKLRQIYIRFGLDPLDNKFNI